MIAEYIEGQNNNPVTQELILPTSIKQYNITYSDIEDRTIVLIFIFGILIIILFNVRDKNNEKLIKEQEKKELALDFPKLLTKLLIYINAGMTIRNVFIHIGNIYLTKRKLNLIKKHKIYEAIVIFNNKLNSGYSEILGLVDMSRYLNDKKYTRFFNILIQNIKNGNKDLKNVLNMEVYNALYERKNNAKKQAEEASTKLILPLMIMLVIIMLSIMVPAMISM